MTREIVTLLLLSMAHSAGQNIVYDFGSRDVLPPTTMDPQRAEEIVRREWKVPTGLPNNSESAQVGRKLAEHVAKLVEGWPWRPFHCTLGISGSETYFDHPAECFYALSGSLPYLPETLRKRAVQLLGQQLVETPPYAVAGFDRGKGRPRERYEVPENLRQTGISKAQSLFGIAAFEQYAVFSQAASFWDDPADLVSPHWNAILNRVRPYLDDEYGAVLEKSKAVPVDAEVLNGDLAGLVSFARMGRRRVDEETYQKALLRITQIAELRVNLERTDPQLLSPARTATKRLHHLRLVRYGRLTREVVGFFGEAERRLAGARLKAFRDARPGWWMAFGERSVGGENYINSPHLAHAVLAGAALIEPAGIDSATLSRWIDVPWCEADLFFIEKCVLTLEAR